MKASTRFAGRTLGVFALVALASCFGEKTTGPEMRRGQLAFAPVFERQGAAGVAAVQVTHVHFVVVDPTTNKTVLDTTVAFPANLDTLDISLPIPLSSGTQTFSLSLDMLDASNATVFHAGPSTVTATPPGVPPPVAPVVLNYVGTGANAKGVRFVTAPTSVFFGDSVTFVAQAYDSNNVTIPNTPIIYSSSDTSKAKLPADTVGKVLARTTRGSVTITAALLTPPSITAPLVVQPKPVAVGITAGNNQTGQVGQALATAITARVKAADSLGVQGVIVTWAVTAGGGQLSKTTDTTNSSGDVTVGWTLGSSLGAQAISITAVGVTGASGTANVGATAAAGPPKKLAFVQQPSAVTANSSISPAVTVAAQDSFGNAVTTFTGSVVVAIGTNAGPGATLGGTLNQNAVAGVATFNNLSLNIQGTGYTLVASSVGLTSATSAAFNVSGGVPSQIAFLQGPPTTAVAGATFAPAVTVQIKDVNGNVVGTATNTITLSLTGTGPAGAHLLGTTSIAAVNGLATFSALNVDSAGTGYTLTATMTGPPSVPTATSSAFTITVGPATTISLVSGNLQIATVGAALASPIVVKVTDSKGNAVAGTTVNWAVVTGGGSPSVSSNTTNASGLAQVTWTSGTTAFTQTATATSGTLTGSPITFTALGTPPGTTKRWIGTTSTDWSIGSNWTPGGIPGTTDSVFVPRTGLFTSNQPVLTAVGATANLFSEPGSVIDVANSVLQVGGNLGVSSIVASGSGSLQLTGTAKNAAGSLPTTSVGGTYTLSALSAIAGTLTVSAGGLTIGGQKLTVTGALNVSGGVLTMTNALDSLLVSGNVAVSSGNSNGGGLTNGVLTVGGNFTQTAGSSQNFPASGNHKTVLNGAGAQSVSFASPGTSSFGNLDIVNTSGGVSFSTSASAGGNVAVLGTTNVTGAAATMTIGGNLTDASNSRWQVGHTSFSGAAPSLPDSVLSNVTFTGTASLPKGFKVMGGDSLSIGSGNLTINGRTVRVTGSVAILAGVLTMTNAADSLLVGGNVMVSSGSSNGGGLSNGVLTVGGSFTQTSGSSQNFPASGNHKTVLNGTAVQLVTFSSPGSSGFANLDISNTAAVSLTTNVSVGGNVAVLGTANVTASTSTATVTIGGNLTDASNSRWQAPHTVFTGSAPSLPDSIASHVTFTGTAALPKGFKVMGGDSLSVGAGNLALNGRLVRVTGSVAVLGGVLTMTNPADSLLVAGNVAVSSGNSNGGGLTNGVLAIGGNFTQTSGSSQNFPASGSHKVVLNGAGAQAVSFSTPGSSTFGSLDIANTSGGVSFSSSATVGGSVAVLGTTNVTGAAATVTIGGSLTDASNTRWQVGHTSFGGSAPSLPDSVLSNVTFTGTATLPKGFKVMGGDSLTVANGSFALNSKTVRASGPFAVTGGVLTMTNATDSLLVTGNFAISSGNSNSGGLTNGVLTVGGNFTQTAGSSLNFPASGSHKVLLNGIISQAVSFSNPGGSFFQNLEINNAAGATFSTNQAINGTVTCTAGNVTGAFNATLAGNLVDASGTRWQVQTTTIGGATPTLPTAISTNLVFAPAAATTIQNRIALTGNLSIIQGTVTMGGHTVTVSGTLTVSGGLLSMMNTVDTMKVAGAATWSTGSSSTGLDTAGVLLVAGNFTQTNGSTQNFVPSNSHRTVLNGTAAQTVSFAATTPGAATFNRLEINNTFPLVTFATNAQVADSFIVTKGTVAGATSLNVTGNVSLATGTTVSMNTVRLGANLAVAAGGGFAPTTTTFTGTGQTIPNTAGIGYTNVVIAGTSVSFAGPTNLAGNLIDSAGNLTIGGHVINVVGALSVLGNLTMSSPSDSLKVTGNVSFTGGSTNNGLTAGVLEVAGNFTQTAGSSQNFAVSGTHTTTFNGFGAQTITFSTPGTGASRFQNLDLRNITAGGVRFASNVEVLGTAGIHLATVTVGDTLGLRTIGIGGNLFDSVGGRWKSNTTIFRGSGTLSFPTKISSNVQMTSATDITAGNNFTIDSSLTVNSGTFTIGGKIVHVGPSGCVNCNMSVTAGTIVMTNAADSLTVGGNAGGNFTISTGTSNSTQLTAGVLAINGNFTQTAGSSINFAPSGSHTVLLRGLTGTQTISFQTPASSFFRRLLVGKGTGSEQMLTDVHAGYFALLGGTYSFTGSGGPPMTQLIADTVAGNSSGSTSMQSPMVLVANLKLVDSNIINVDTLVLGYPGAAITTSGPTGNAYTLHSVRVTDSIAPQVGPLTIPADLVIGSSTNPGVITVPASSTLTVTGNLKTQGNGYLRMTSGGSVSVGDSAIFAGGSETGRLTAGTLSVSGNFVQTSVTSTSSFAPSGTHTTSFVGSAGVQTISFANPIVSFFNALTISKGSSAAGVSVRLLTDALVNNGLTMPGAANPDTLKGPGAHIKVAGGALSMTQSTSSPVLDSISSVELVNLPTVGFSPVVFSPDTTIYSGTMTIPTTSAGNFVYQSVRIAAAVTLAASSTLTTTKDLVIDGSTANFTMGNQATIGGNLVTRNSGILTMSFGILSVTGNATFSGGTSSLTGGTLNLSGNFTQNTTGTAFAASSLMTTVFQGTAGQTVTFANPSAYQGSGSYFGTVLIARNNGSISQAEGFTLGSNMGAALVRDSATNGVVDSIAGAGFIVTINGLQTGNNFVFNNAPVVLGSTTAPTTTFTSTGLSFNQMNATSTFLALTAPLSNVLSVSNLHFNTTPTTGKYFTTAATGFNFIVTSGGLPTITGPGILPFVLNTNYTKGAGNTISWNGTSL